MTLDADEFIRRFLIHVLPDGFHRIRHYGLFANGNRAGNIALARRLLGVPDPPPSSGHSGGTENRHDDNEWHACPCCGGALIILATAESRRPPPPSPPPPPSRLYLAGVRKPLTIPVIRRRPRSNPQGSTL